jgi:hypothetical protein
MTRLSPRVTEAAFMQNTTIRAGRRPEPLALLLGELLEDGYVERHQS